MCLNSQMQDVKQIRTITNFDTIKTHANDTFATKRIKLRTFTIL